MCPLDVPVNINLFDRTGHFTMGCEIGILSNEDIKPSVASSTPEYFNLMDRLNKVRLFRRSYE